CMLDREPNMPGVALFLTTVWGGEGEVPMRPVGGRFIFCALSVLSCSAAVSAVDITIRPEIEYQTIVGFGGHDPRDQVQTLVRDLGMSAHRDWINCETAAGSGTGWNRMQQLYNEGVEVFIASPWSPPPHMKYVNNCVGRDHYWNRLSNGLGPGNDYRHPTYDSEPGGLRNFYPDFAAHLVKYIRNFENNVPGAKVYAISPQNEPHFAQSYASCVYEVNTQSQINQMRDVILEIGQKLEAENLSRVKIFAAEDMLTAFTVRPYVQMAMADPTVAPYVGAVAVHGYSNGVNPAPTTDLATRWGHPMSGAGTFAWKKGIDCWMTETSGYMGWAGGQGPDGQASGAQELGVAMFAALKYGKISGWWWWRLAVTESYWEDECLIYNGNKTKQYHVSKHFYKHIRPGAVMLHVNDSADADLGVIAFRHKERNTLALVVVNSASSSREVNLVCDDLPSNSFQRWITTSSANWQGQSDVHGRTFTVPANSFTTLFATGYNPQVTSRFEHFSNGRFTANALRNNCVARVYSLDGRLVRRIHRPRFSQGKLVWDGRAADGSRVPSGSYYAVMTDDAGTTVRAHTTVSAQ
ncbi:MAG: hypothetical protein GF331_17025, partial [Chitinivibrionales bacterium]|nr:hypothetical protein [Chitinivibrionales bacterium]